MSSTLQAKHRWTYSDLVALPDDQLRHELIDGEHFVSPSPTTTHQEISKRLFLALDAHAEPHRLGEVLYAPFGGRRPQETACHCACADSRGRERQFAGD